MQAPDRNALLNTLKARFEHNPRRHPGIAWLDVRRRLDDHPMALPALGLMEATGGEPDVIAQVAPTGEILFCDCCAESPAGRRSACYDRLALDARKDNQPENSAVEWAATIGIELLNEQQYRDLQKLGEFDTRTSSCIRPPPAVRQLGGALFCDRRYGQVFVYHNGAQSYDAARGFRGVLRV